MNLEKLYQSSGFNKVKTELVENATFDLTIAKIMTMAHQTNYSKIISAQDSVKSAIEFFAGNFKLLDVSKADEALEQINNGGVVSISKIIPILNILKNARVLKERTNAMPMDNKIATAVKNLYRMDELEKEISDLVDGKTETLIKTASRELTFISAALLEVEQEIGGVFTKLTIIKDEYIVDREPCAINGRTCLKVRPEFKSMFRGKILDSKPNAIFLEPSELYELNSKYIKIKSNEVEEKYIILKNICSTIKIDIKTFAANLSALIDIDYFRALGKFTTDNKLTFASIPADGHIAYEGIRTRFADSTENNINVEYPVNIIFGTTQTGKTEFLRMIALNQVLHQAGLGVFASNAKLPVFENIFALIDDTDVMAQTKTFKMALDNRKDSLTIVDDSLVKMEENESKSLLLSILEILKDCQSTTFISNNLSALIAYARDEKKVGIYSFDVKNGYPTYKLEETDEIASSLQTIIKRSGLSNDVFEKAMHINAHISDRNDAALNKANTLMDKIGNDKLSIKKRMEELDRQANELALERQEIENLKETFDIEAKMRVREIVGETKTLLRQEYRDGKAAKQESIRTATIHKGDGTHITSAGHHIDVKVGDDVMLDSFHKKGRVKIVHDDGDITVDLDGITIKLHRYEIHTLNDSQISKSQEVGVKDHDLKVPADIHVNEPNIAMVVEHVTKYFDACEHTILTNVSLTVTDSAVGKKIRAVGRLLERDPRVESFVTSGTDREMIFEVRFK